MKSWKVSSLRARRSLIVGVFLLLLLGFAAVDLFVTQPQRVARERQARREAPPKLVRPSQRAEDAPERKVLTAFRVEEWQAAPIEDAADAYLKGYMTMQEGAGALESGQLAEAQEKFERANQMFRRIQRGRPEFEPEMVAYRLRKLEDAIARIKNARINVGGAEFLEQIGDWDRGNLSVAPMPQTRLITLRVEGDPADFYLSGYLLVQEAEANLEQGNLQGAKEKFAKAAMVFDSLSQSMPDFEPDLVDFRRRKIEKALAEVDKVVPKPSKPQSSIDGRSGGAAGREGEMQIARK